MAGWLLEAREHLKAQAREGGARRARGSQWRVLEADHNALALHAQ